MYRKRPFIKCCHSSIDSAMIGDNITCEMILNSVLLIGDASSTEMQMRKVQPKCKFLWRIIVIWFDVLVKFYAILQPCVLICDVNYWSKKNNVVQQCVNLWMPQIAMNTKAVERPSHFVAYASCSREFAWCSLLFNVNILSLLIFWL